MHSGFKYVTPVKDRHGKPRYRFRRKGVDVYIHGEFGSEAFLAEYADALKLKPKRKTVKHGKKSIDALISLYLDTEVFKTHSDSTRYNYKRILKVFSKEYGAHSTLAFQSRHIRKIMHDKQSTPDAANRLLSMLNILFKLAIRMGWRDDNPCMNVENYKTVTKGFPDWTRPEIVKYLSYWPEGSNQRLALLLLYYTGQRSGDVYRFGARDLSGGNQLRVVQNKTATALTLFIHPELEKALKPVADQDVFLHSSRNQPFKSAKSFQKWFVDSAKAAGIKGKSAHGLRKSLSAHLVDAGATEREVMATIGHKTSEMVRLYTKGANQEKLAIRAINRLKPNLTKGERNKNESN